MREELKEGQEFQYLGSTVQSNGQFVVKEVVRVCKARRAAVLFGFETVALRIRGEETELESAKIQRFRFRRKQMIGCGDPRSPKEKKMLKLKL